MRMRAAGAALIAAAALGAGTVAVAQQTQVNEYAVDGDVMPNKVGTKKKPLPVGLKFAYTTREASGLRPAVVDTYTISFYGGRENTNLFPGCSAEDINNAQSDSVCPKGAKIGSGELLAYAGADNDVSDQSIKCPVDITIYNSRKGRAAIYLKTGPPTCVIPISQAIDARFVDAFGGKGRGMRFSVPPTLKHPLRGLSVAVMDVDTVLPRKTRRVKGKLRGYFESTEPCVKGERWMEVEFVTESGERATARDTKAC